MLLERICAPANASIIRKIDYTTTKAVFHPSNLQEVREAITFAKEHGLTITAKGGGTSLSGAATGGNEEKIIITTNNFRQILEINQEQGYAWVEPGLTPVELNKQLERKRIPLRYLVSPSSRNVATLGGMLATDAGGNESWLFGTTRDNLLAVEIMDYHGNQIFISHEDLRCTNKELQQRLHAVGFGLHDIAANHGTLGFITKMQVALHPISNEERFWATINFEGLDDFGRAIIDIIERRIPLQYSEAVIQINTEEIDSELTPPMLLIEASEAQKSELGAYGEITTLNKSRFEELKELRAALPKKTPVSGTPQISLFEGYGIPTDQFPKLAEHVAAINEILTTYNIPPFLKYGHAPSKWYDQDIPCYGLIMHSREIRPEEKTGEELIEIITTLIDFCLVRNITPKPEHKWPYLQDKKRARLTELAILFENMFNPFVLTYGSEDLAVFI